MKTAVFAALALACVSAPACAQQTPAEFFSTDPYRPGASLPAPGRSRSAVRPASARGAPAHSGLHAMVTAAAVRNGVPHRLMHGVIKVESGYRCNAYNARGGAHGIGQVKPATARSVGVRGSLFNCSTGIEAAARYLRLAINRGGASCAGVSLYERGIYARPVCTGYGRKVMRAAA